MQNVVVLGAGPAGLTASYQLAKNNLSSVLVEKDSVVGGLSRTARYNGFRFDIGGHRFFTKVPEVSAMWNELLPEDFVERPRLSRIYYRNKFFRYPLQPFDALSKLGLAETLAVVGSYAQSRMWPRETEESFEDWVTNRFGKRLYGMFFKTYTEKVWGIPAAEISADWAAQRIQNLSLAVALRNALSSKGGGAVAKTLIERFHYPRLGPGQMWERCCSIIQNKGHDVLMNTDVSRISHRAGRVTSVTVRGADGPETCLDASHVISSLALVDVVRLLDPLPPRDVLEAASRLRYRDFLTVCLIIDRKDLFKDNWIYVHSPEVHLGRIQNYKNWSADMVPDQGKTCLGLEYFVWENQGLWSKPDDELIALGTRELQQLRLAEPREVIDGTVIRMRRAYPVYDGHYRAAVNTIKSYLDTIPNLHQVGRNGQHRYNNQDHSMLTSMLAVENICGARNDIWTVNAEQAYHETVDRDQPKRRLVAGSV